MMAKLVSDAGILGEGLFDQSRTRGQLVSSTPGAITRIDAVPNVSASIIDVGAGASTLVDDLLQLGYTDVTVLDISGAALDFAKQRLGEASRSVRWKCADVTRADLAPGQFDLWHDRAVFHLLTVVEERRDYVATVPQAVKPGGHVIVSTFGPQGPVKCSGWMS